MYTTDILDWTLFIFHLGLIVFLWYYNIDFQDSRRSIQNVEDEVVVDRLLAKVSRLEADNADLRKQLSDALEQLADLQAKSNGTEGDHVVTTVEKSSSQATLPFHENGENIPPVLSMKALQNIRDAEPDTSAF